MSADEIGNEIAELAGPPEDRVAFALEVMAHANPDQPCTIGGAKARAIALRLAAVQTVAERWKWQYRNLIDSETPRHFRQHWR